MSVERLLLPVLLGLMLLLACAAPAALASGVNNYYIIPDSDTRLLTEEELWGWQYEAVGFIYNEIFARQGVIPRPEGKRYGRDHAAYLIFVCLTKQVIAIGDIQQLRIARQAKGLDFPAKGGFLEPFHALPSSVCVVAPS